jgi:homoserine dehydrogenase
MYIRVVTSIRIAFLGYGNVNRALHALLERRRDALARDYTLQCEVVGVANRSNGWRAGDRDCAGISEWLDAARPAVVFEAIPLDARAGQPALDYLRAVLERGIHAISANKGPLVFGYRELRTLAAANQCAYRFESAVMDGAPVFSLVRDCLPLAGLRAIHGVFTSTATIVIEAVERGLSIEEGIAEAQRLGIAEADPSYDVDGCDSAMKLCALANVLFGGDLRPADVHRQGIRDCSAAEIRDANDAGTPIRLIGELVPAIDGTISAHVHPARCAVDSPLGAARGTTLVMHYEADVFPGGLTITSRDPDPTTTAYGMLADMIAVCTNARAQRTGGESSFQPARTR